MTANLGMMRISRALGVEEILNSCREFRQLLADLIGLLAEGADLFFFLRERRLGLARFELGLLHLRLAILKALGEALQRPLPAYVALGREITGEQRRGQGLLMPSDLSRGMVERLAQLLE